MIDGYISFLFFSVICFVGVIAFVRIHKEKLKQILKYNSETLKEAKYMQQPYLVIINILLAPAIMFIAMAFIKIDIFGIMDILLSFL